MGVWGYILLFKIVSLVYPTIYEHNMLLNDR